MAGFDDKSHAVFPPTRWSMVRSAAAGSETAVEVLSQQYCGAVYAYFRRDGKEREHAADLTQEFFAEYILDPARRQGVLKTPDQAKFRTWLKSCLLHFAINASKRDQAAKRGGSKPALSLDVESTERSVSAASETDPSRQFDRQWAQELLERVLRKLVAELAPKPREIFKLTAGRMTDAQIAARVEMTEEAVAKARTRAIGRARELLAAELRESVSSPEDLGEELAELGRIYSLPAWLGSA